MNTYTPQETEKSEIKLRQCSIFTNFAARRKDDTTDRQSVLFVGQSAKQLSQNRAKNRYNAKVHATAKDIQEDTETVQQSNERLRYVCRWR